MIHPPVLLYDYMVTVSSDFLDIYHPSEKIVCLCYSLNLESGLLLEQ